MSGKINKKAHAKVNPKLGVLEKASTFDGYAMTMLLPSGKYIVRYLIPVFTDGHMTTGYYSEGIDSTFEKAAAEAVAGLARQGK